ncbi:hypothetical protein MXD81_19100, partial [Microbacteriaceae bacterium K1510]|nr:hypothetical protein [Microbacteriaceae bacterium K1510]
RILLVGLKEEFLLEVLSDHLETTGAKPEFAPWGEEGTEAFRRLAEKTFLQSLQGGLGKTEIEQLEWELANLMLSLQPGTHREAWRNKRPIVAHNQLQQALDYIH